MRKILFVVPCFLILSVSLNKLGAQSIESIKADRETYLWGEGSGSTIKAADQAALADIIGQISTQVENTTEGKTFETNDDFKKTWSYHHSTFS